VDEIARRLEQLREAKGWSGREFSRNAKLGEAQFRQIQVRGGARASTTTLRAFAEAASASLDWLLTGDGAPFPDATPAEPKRAGNGPSSSHNFSEFPRYSELEKAARKMDPDIPEWVWPLVRAANPLWIGARGPTAANIAAFARIVMEHGDPSSVTPSK
jgi:transcriptional regulator with XRE-family HTH domain